MSYKLYNFHGGPASRRVDIFLQERSLPKDLVQVITCTIKTPDAPAEAPGKPSGSVPILQDTSSGFVLHESLAVMEYLDKLAVDRGSDTKYGSTTLERAKINEMMGLTETLVYLLKYLPCFGCKLFVSVVEGDQSPGGVRFMLKKLHTTLARTVKCAAPLPSEDGSAPWLMEAHRGGERTLTVADCSLFGILQYARHMFGWDLTADYPRLAEFYSAFEKRESAAIPEGTWPPAMTELTKAWIEY